MFGTSAESVRPAHHPRLGLTSQAGGVAASLLKLAQTLRSGGATAGVLVASPGVSGFQVISNPETASLTDLRQELAALRARLEDSLLSGSTSPSEDVDEARQSLAEAATELARPDTEIPRLLLRLSWAADHLLRAGDTARLTDDLTPAHAQLAVAAATLWRIAMRLFSE
ncbi:MAG: hypothetical protein KDD47_12690 [Acidobacteria bacterium]|nr:hypothetical protein [Acidobacteriota bacterium]